MTNAEFAGNLITKTLKQLEHERLIQSKVVPAAELAKQKQETIERAAAFTRAATEEEFVNRTERSSSVNCPTPIGERMGVVTREPFEEQP